MTKSRPKVQPRIGNEASAAHAVAAKLSVHVIDLRAEYEAKLRILSSIRREIEAMRAGAGSAEQRRRSLAKLDKQFADLSAGHRDTSGALRMVRDELARFLGEQGTLRRGGPSGSTGSAAAAQGRRGRAGRET